MRRTKLKPHWCPTGWHATADGGRKIEYTLHLPAGVRATVRRWNYQGPWYWWIGSHSSNTYDRAWKGHGPFQTSLAAASACEKKLRQDVALVLHELRRR